MAMVGSVLLVVIYIGLTVGIMATVYEIRDQRRQRGRRRYGQSCKSILMVMVWSHYVSDFIWVKVVSIGSIVATSFVLLLPSWLRTSNTTRS